MGFRDGAGGQAHGGDADAGTSAGSQVARHGTGLCRPGVEANASYQIVIEGTSYRERLSPHRALLTDLPELGTLDRRQIAALVGVVPFNRDSSTLRGRRAVWGGRSRVRGVLYMGTLTATRYNPAISGFYQRLLRSVRRRKWPLVACMRKLLTILNAMVKDNSAWRGSCPAEIADPS